MTAFWESDAHLAYRLAGLRPADEESRHTAHAFALFDDNYSVLAEHHARDDRDSFWLVHDHSAVFGLPGQAQLIAFHVRRDLSAGTFRCASSTEPLIPLAQRWLIHRGCPPQATALRDPRAAASPADEATTRVEERLRLAPDLEVLDHFTHEPNRAQDAWFVHATVHDHHPGARPKPYRVFLETSLEGSYTLREGAFPDAESADAWLEECLEDPSLPLPPTAPPGIPAALPPARPPEPGPGGRSRR